MSREKPPQSTAPSLIIIGGGVHGLMAALMAAERGHRPLLLERDRVGEATSAAWFRILHGGLRYLQSLDIPRLRQSVTDRRAVLQALPELAAPRPFLMPLYGRGMKRRAAFRAAFLVERLLAFDRNRGVGPGAILPPGRTMSAAATLAEAPGIAPEGLEGGALWYEAVARDATGITAALRRHAEAAGARISEGVTVTGLLTHEGAVAGVTGLGPRGAVAARAGRVLNAAGPWAGALARRLDPKAPDLVHPALAFNLLLDRTPPSEMALALDVPGGEAMLFVQPRDGKLWAGTWYAPWPAEPGPPKKIAPDAETRARAIADLNAALPGFEATEAQILEVTAGLLPAAGPGETRLNARDVIHDHGRSGGPAGLVTVSGVKFTTARSVAEQALARLGL